MLFPAQKIEGAIGEVESTSPPPFRPLRAPTPARKTGLRGCTEFRDQVRDPTRTSVPGIGLPNSSEALPPRRNNSSHSTQPPPDRGQPLLPGANASRPGAT